METLPLISVIIPAFNNDSFISRCLESVINQTYNNLEIIVIDDGSTDHTSDIVMSYAAKDARIIYKRFNNSGVSVSRNIGITMAKGEFIAFVDSDDYIDVDFIQELFHLIANEKTKIVTCHAHNIDEDGKVLDQILLDNSIRHVDYQSYNYVKHYSHHVSWGALFDSNIVKSLSFSNEFKVGEDTVFFYEALQLAGSVSDLNKRLYYYVHRNHSLSSGKYKWDQFDEILAWDRIVELSRKQSIPSQLSCKTARSIRTLNGIQKYLRYEEKDQQLWDSLVYYLRKERYSILFSKLSFRLKAVLLFASFFPHFYSFLYTVKRL